MSFFDERQAGVEHSKVTRFVEVIAEAKARREVDHNPQQVAAAASPRFIINSKAEIRPQRLDDGLGTSIYNNDDRNLDEPVRAMF